MKWYDDIGETFGCVMTPHRAATWLEIIDEGIPGISETELDQVARFIRKRPDIDKTRRPSATNMISWIKWFRKESHAERYGYSRGTDEGAINAVWQAMTRAPDHEARWNLLVDGGEPLPPDQDGHNQERRGWGNEQRHGLEIQARGRWSDWDDAIYALKKRMIATQTRVFSTIAENMTAVVAHDEPF